MKRFLVALLVGLALPALLFANLQDALKQVDTLHDQGQYEQCVTALQSALSLATTNQAKAEVYWRLSRALLNQGNKLKDAKAPEAQTLAKYEEGESWADKAIEANPASHQGYFWKSSNIGMWGQTKGVLNALAKAKPMKDLLEKALSVNNNHPDSYFVLGQLYRELPGWPVSFGDPASAVSCGRLSIQLNQEEVRAGKEAHLNYNFHIELAKSLYARNWNAAKRTTEQRRLRDNYNKARTPSERGMAFEGTVTLANRSDREEAVEMVRNAISSLQRIPNRTVGQNDDLKKAQEVLAGW